ncbi:hypothetical protein FQ085_11540 [Planococcus sp. ANT_H30]|uniref:N-acetylmuramoyl-L-alanine amidase n=1 Tax=Planococcus sp. ANT_H30 TaxID=2597347 RepID=UPI0011EC6F4F|nr:N-acetylmuramoyl-L-alanine amidase [Planococcus sp. ANT_H30]KAA0956620.1 hypothetical protein FQ085_11540 [Planococcus sp. ANT_H30]
MAKLLIEPGHGANTFPPSKGTYAKGGVSGMAEHDFNAAVTDEANSLLKGKLTTYSAQPSKGTDVSLGARIAKYNAQYKEDKTTIGMSNHGNAGNEKTRGFGVFYWHTSATAKKLAQMLLVEYKLEFPDMPIWGNGLFPCVPGTWTDFYLVRETAAPFILIEWEFFTNDAARKTMLSTDYRKRCGKVAAKTACKWYGIKFDESGASTSTERDYLLLNDTGSKVKSLQSDLVKVGYKLTVDGIYGKVTEDAVKAFQRGSNLSADGIWGKASQSVMDALLANVNKPKPKPEAGTSDKPKEEIKVEYKKDAQPSASLAKEFHAAVKNGLTDGTYPQRPATREEVAVMVNRAYEKIKK